MFYSHRRRFLYAAILIVTLLTSCIFSAFSVRADEYYSPEIYEVPYLIHHSNAAIVFNTLTRDGFSKETAFGILADLQNISPTLDPHYSDGQTVGVVRADLDDLNNFAAQYGEVWPEIQLKTQIEYLIYCFNCGIWDNDITQDYIDEYGQDYVCVPFDDFKYLENARQALVCFRACYTFEPFITMDEAKIIENNISTYRGYVATLTGSAAVLSYVDFAIRFALDDAHGYRNVAGYNVGNPDFDCGGLISSSLWHAGILPANDIYEPNSGIQWVLMEYGFQRMPFTSMYELRTGDVLYRAGHTEMYVGAGLLVGAHSNQGHPEIGDQTGTEVDVSAFRDGGWEYVFRYPY